MRLTLVRHAKPLVAAGICYGALDLDADAASTEAAALALSDVLPSSITLLSSPLQRCAQLTQALCLRRPDLDPRYDARLAEMDFGSWEGQRWDAIARAGMEAWTKDFAHYRPGGGESVSAFMARVAQVFDETRLAGRDAAWITHAGVIRAAQLLQRGVREVSNAASWPLHAPAFGRWIVMETAT